MSADMDDVAIDYYETLQISPNADPDMVHRVYRLMAQRFHPDNPETGNAARFRQIHDAYLVLGDAEQRARYDALHEVKKQARWRIVSNGNRVETDYDIEQTVRFTVLEVLYTRRKYEPREPGMYDMELERLVGRTNEQLEFTIWYLMSKGLVKRGDGSKMTITADGVDYLEQNYEMNAKKRLLEQNAL